MRERTIFEKHEVVSDAHQELVARLKASFDAQAFRWRGIEPQAYRFSLGDQRGMGWRGVTRYTLGGPPALPARLELRYFELATGGYSSLEKHAHIHLVLAIRGKGKALVGHTVFDLAPFDLLHVPPDTPHRWINEEDEPFGFLCPVDAERDPPQPLVDEEWDALRRDPITAPYAF